MSDLSNQAQKLLGRFSKTVDVMKSAYSKRNKMMFVWADDLYAVEAVMSFLETIRDAPAQGEPVAWRWRDGPEETWTVSNGKPHDEWFQVEALYASPISSGQMNGEIKRPVQGWEVEVRINGGTALTIGHNHLCGMENIDEFKDVVENCGRHLIAFIGAPYERSPGGSEDELLRQMNIVRDLTIENDQLRALVEAQNKALDWIRANKGAHPENIVKVIEQFCPGSTAMGSQ